MADWGLIATATATGGLVIFNALKTRQEKRAKRMEEEAGLRPNPTRCQDHATAINELRLDVRAIKDHLGIV